MPQQLNDVFIALIPKTDGGNRPIGWYQSLFRVWSKARLTLVKFWERDYTNLLGFAAPKGRSPTDIVWRHALNGELATVSSKHFGCILWDIRKCYEFVNHEILIDCAHRHDYPLAVLRICLQSYRTPRRILLNGLVSSFLEPTAGILAGCSKATSLLRLYLLDLMHSNIGSHPSVSLNIYIDDLALDASADNKQELVSLLTDAARDISFDLDNTIQLPIARQKSAVIANSTSTACLLRRCLGELGGPRLGVVRPLGVDYSGGKPPTQKGFPGQKTPRQ